MDCCLGCPCTDRDTEAPLSGIIGLSSDLFTYPEEIAVSKVQGSVATQQHSGESAREHRVKHPLRIALFGFGTVGSSVARILVESKPQGLELTHVFNRGVARKRVDWVPRERGVERGRRGRAGFGCGCDCGAGGRA